MMIKRISKSNQNKQLNNLLNKMAHQKKKISSPTSKIKVIKTSSKENHKQKKTYDSV